MTTADWIILLVRFGLAVFAAMQSLHYIKEHNHGGAIAWAVVWYGIASAHD